MGQVEIPTIGHDRSRRVCDGRVGHHGFALTPGVHSLYIETSARHTGAAQATVHVPANGILELHDSAPMLGQFEGALGSTPQKIPYRWAYALLLGLALLILVISVILWPS